MALAGLFLAGWAYEASDGRTFVWALAIMAGAPLLRLLIGAPVKRKAASAEPAPIASATSSEADAEIAAKIAQFHAAKQAYYEQHVKRSADSNGG